MVGGVLMSVGHTRQGPETYAAKKKEMRGSDDLSFRLFEERKTASMPTSKNNRAAASRDPVVGWVCDVRLEPPALPDVSHQLVVNRRSAWIETPGRAVAETKHARFTVDLTIH